MNIVVVRTNEDCLKKEMGILPDEFTKSLSQNLRIKSNPFSFGISDIQKGIFAKNNIELFKNDFESYPQLMGLKQLLVKCGDEENIVLINGDKYSNYDIYIINTALHEYYKGYNPVEVYHYLKYSFPSTFFPRHNIYFYADLGYDQFIGPTNGNIRKCRFCDSTDPHKFGKKKCSHAISLFMGNTALFCLEECEECNNRFGKGIELDLANYYEYYRAAERRVSRTSKKQIIAKGFNYEYNGVGLKFTSFNPIAGVPKVGESIPKDGFVIDLHNRKPVILHNVYKILVKYVISCIPGDLLDYFSETIKWINGGKRPRKGSLPPVFRYEKLYNVEKPSLCIYIRKDDKMDLPFCVGELRFMEFLYVYAIPYCKKDVMNEYLVRPLKSFVLQRFPQIDFTIENFCDDEEKMIINHVKIEGTPNTILQPLQIT